MAASRKSAYQLGEISAGMAKNNIGGISVMSAKMALISGSQLMASAKL
jgi:hypothetical protein